jgi:predicted DsbA family dithiol-disulfide isomerase
LRCLSSVRLRYHTDPACSASWAAEPRLRRLQREFGAEVEITYVMGGLAREYSGDLSWLAFEWLDAAARSGMPVDPRVWQGNGALRSTFPACMAVKAAAEQGPDAAARYLRALREGILCRQRKLDSPEPLVEEARGARLDAERFRVDLGSHAILEAFGADLEENRTIPVAARERGLARAGTHGSKDERLAFPALRFVPAADAELAEERWCGGDDRYEDWRAAATAAGAVPSGEPAPDLLGALRGFGSMAATEIEAVCELPGPRAKAELWRLASEWRVRPEPFLTGELWQLA